MLRVIDFEAAMSARPAARDDETAAFVLSVEDHNAPWNEGTWQVGVAEGRTLVARSDAAPELTVSERVLAPVFNGHIRPSLAHEAGLFAAVSEDALDRADRVFAVKRPPFFPDHF
jgi:predicted acetyltransferase